MRLFGHGTVPMTLSPRLKLLNALDPLADMLHVAKLKENPQHYIRKAQQRTGLSDLGPYPLEQPLKHMLHAMKHDAQLNLFGRLGVTEMTIRSLENNLMLQAEFTRNPQLKDVDVENPIIIICSPRSGGALLHNLMNRNQKVRTLKLWELHQPCPPPHPDSEFSDTRIQKSQQQLDNFYRHLPEIKSLQLFSPQAIDECSHLFLSLFSCRQNFISLSNRCNYTDWLMQQDMVPAYQAYKRYLQLLKFHYPNELLILKSSSHLLQLDALQSVFPNARIIHLHRDPAISAELFCNLTEAFQRIFRKSVDPQKIGETWKENWSPALLNFLQWREKTNLEVLDISYRELVRNPTDTVFDIFENFNEHAAWFLKDSITDYLKVFEKDDNLNRHYQLERYGLNRAAIYRELTDYMSVFAVQQESI